MQTSLVISIIGAVALVGCAPANSADPGAIGATSNGADGGGDGGGGSDGSAPTMNNPSPTPMPQTLAVPPRAQWEENNGYCAETSLQSIALYYGAWLSQQVVRTAANQTVPLPAPGDKQSYAAQSQVLIGWDTTLEDVPSPSGDGNNMEKALALLHVDFEAARDEWQPGSHGAQDFEVWLKGNIAAGVPVIFAAYVADAGSDSSLNYDHIMPAFGIGYTTLAAFDGNDMLTWASNFDPDGTSTSLVTPRAASTLFSQSMQATPKSARCQFDTLSGGCIPQNRQYGYAIRGFGNPLPVRVTSVAAVSAPSDVAANGEPDLPNGEAPVTMTATIECGGLIAGDGYVLQKFDYALTDIYAAHPDGSSIFATPVMTSSFVAGGAKFSTSDTFSSDHAVYWRCVKQ